jgi:hypothetical protein
LNFENTATVTIDLELERITHEHGGLMGHPRFILASYFMRVSSTLLHPCIWYGTCVSLMRQ